MKLIAIALLVFISIQMNASGQINNLFETDKVISFADSLLGSKENTRVFVKISSKETLHEVLDFNKWPSNIEKVYNLLMNDDCPILFVEVPISESGDSKIENRYYFNNKGRVIATKAKRSFFNSICVDGVLRETVTTYFDSSFNEIKSERFLRNKSDTLIDTSDCVMNYVDYFNIYRKFTDTPISSSIRN